VRRSDELKSAVLDAMAHEIRNPNNSAKLAATTLLSEHAGGELDRREMLTIIDEELNRRSEFIKTRAWHDPILSVRAVEVVSIHFHIGAILTSAAERPMLRYGTTSRTSRRARSDKRPWRRWHSRYRAELRICNLQIPGGGHGFESHPRRHLESRCGKSAHASFTARERLVENSTASRLS